MGSVNRVLPMKLLKEPLIDALFEFRFTSREPASNILPGALYAQLGGAARGMSVQRMPLAQVPEQIRRSDPNLHYAPIVRIDWGNFLLLVGESSLAVACKLPYPGWKVFRPAISQVVAEVAKIGIVRNADRYSLKYVDLVPVQTLDQQVSALNWDIRLGSHKLSAEVATIRVEVPRGIFRHIINIQTGAVAVPDGPGRSPTEGVIVDVDSIRSLENTDISTFLNNLDSYLEAIHIANKEVFFECLTPETLNSLEPVYD